MAHRLSKRQPLPVLIIKPYLLALRAKGLRAAVSLPVLIIKPYLLALRAKGTPLGVPLQLTG